MKMFKKATFVMLLVLVIMPATFVMASMEERAVSGAMAAAGLLQMAAATQQRVSPEQLNLQPRISTILLQLSRGHPYRTVICVVNYDNSLARLGLGDTNVTWEFRYGGRYSPHRDVVGIINNRNASYSSALFVRSDGSFWQIGENLGGFPREGLWFAGLREAEDKFTVQGTFKWHDIVNSDGNYFLTTDGTLWRREWAWGPTNQCIGFSARRVLENVIAFCDRATAYSGSTWLTAAITADGGVWYWSDDFQFPVPITRLTQIHGAVDISFAGFWLHVLTDNGDLLQFRVYYEHDYLIQLMDRGAVSHINPIPERILDDVVKFRSISSAQHRHASSVALRADGTLWTWGDNFYGRIGDGAENVFEICPSMNRYTVIEDNARWQNPALIMGNVVAFSTNANTTIALQSDGSLWGWGLGFRYDIPAGIWRRDLPNLNNYLRADHLRPLHIRSGVLLP